jgi:hypothetical protein
MQLALKQKIDLFLHDLQMPAARFTLFVTTHPASILKRIPQPTMPRAPH